jgi:hypothetical protein
VNPGDTTLVRAPDPIWISLKGAKPPSRRTADEAILVRAPAVFRALTWLTLKLPRGSRLRQAVIRRAALQAQGAWMRRDFAAGVIRFAPGYVLTVGEGDRMRLDFEASYRGRDGVRAFTQTYQDAFGDSSYEPRWIVDLGGDMFVMLVHHSLHGRASGASVEQVIAHRVKLHGGFVVREEVHCSSSRLGIARADGRARPRRFGSMAERLTDRRADGQIATSSESWAC